MFNSLNMFRAFTYSRMHLIQSLERSNRLLCSTSTLASTIDESISNDHKTLVTLYNEDRNSTEINDFLFKCFFRELNCYTFALNLTKLTNQTDSDRNRNLNLIIMLALDNWLDQNNPNTPLTLDIKQKALEIAPFHSDKAMLTMLSKVYKMQEDSKILQSYVENLIDDGKYEEAYHCTEALNIQNELPLERLFLPLAIRNKVSLILKYLSHLPELQLKAAKLLDGLLDERNFHEIKKFNIKSNKSLSRCLSAIIQQYNIPIDLCPNIQKVKSRAAMTFLLNKKFEKSISESSWENMTLGVVKDYPDLQKMLIEKLAVHDKSAALKIVKHFNIPITNLPPILSEVMSSQRSNFDTSNELDFHEIKKDTTPAEEHGTSFEYLSLDTSKVSLYFIDNSEDYFNCLKDISQNYKIVGIDSEWKAQFGLQKLRLSLIQLAVTGKVYILDMLALDNQLVPEHWNMLMDSVFSNPNLIKLGCGVMQDAQMLVEDYKGTPGKIIKFSHFLDVGILFDEVQSLYQFELRDFLNDPPGTKSLSKLCQIVLNKPLNKDLRICDWEVRPLSNSQMAYAALDAYCQLQMYDGFQQRCKRHSFDFEKAVFNALDNTAGISKNACKVKKGCYRWERQIHSFAFQPSVTVDNFRIIMEERYTALGLKLRMYGADVTILKNSENGINLVESSLTENRVLFMSKDTYEKVRKHVSEEKIYIVGENDTPDEKTVARVFKTFNVHMSAKAIYSRCMSCNENEFLIIPCEDLKQIWLSDQSESKISENNENVYTYEDISVSSQGLLDSGIQMQLNNVSLNDFKETEMFKVCRNCGYIHCQR